MVRFLSQGALARPACTRALQTHKRRLTEILTVRHMTLLCIKNWTLEKQRERERMLAEAAAGLNYRGWTEKLAGLEWCTKMVSFA